MVNIHISNRVLFVVLLLGALLVMTGFSYASWPSGKTVYHDAGDVKVTVGSSDYTLKEVVDDLYDDIDAVETIAQDKNCIGVTTELAWDAKLLFFTVWGDNICADEDGCSYYTMYYNGNNLGKVSEGVLYQNPSTNEWWSTYEISNGVVSSVHGVNGNGVDEWISGGICAIRDDSNVEVTTASGSKFTDNGATAVALIDMSGGHCFYRVCD